MRSCILLATVALASAQSSLFFSEYVEGTYYNKAVEIYNPTGATVSLDKVVVQWHHNGKVFNQAAKYDVPLAGKTIGARKTFVICRDHNQKAGRQVAASKCDMQVAHGSVAANAVLHNGDDAVELIVDGKAVDVIGKVGSDPGSCWKNAQGKCMTKDQTMRRVGTVSQGVDTFDIAQWTLEGKNAVDGLGKHAFVAPTTTTTTAAPASANNEPKGSSPVYPNPAWSKGWCNKWQQLPDQGRAGYKAEHGRTFFHKPTSPAECAAKCDAHPDCTQAVYEEGGPWGQECWLGGQTSDKTDRGSRGCNRQGGPCVDHCYHPALAAAAATTTAAPAKPADPQALENDVVWGDFQSKSFHHAMRAAVLGHKHLESLNDPIVRPAPNNITVIATEANATVDYAKAHHYHNLALEEGKRQFGAGGAVTHPDGKPIYTNTNDARYNKNGYFLPPKNVQNYSPGRTRKCCDNSCHQRYLQKSHVATKSCKVGCGLWLGSSSLNWESKTWHALLRNKCRKTCEVSNKAEEHAKRVRAGVDPATTLYSKYAKGSAKFQTYFKRVDLVADDVESCKQGCEEYMTCIYGLESTPLAHKLLPDVGSRIVTPTTYKERHAEHREWKNVATPVSP